MDEKYKLLSVSDLMSFYPNSLASSLDSQILVLEGFYSNNNGRLYGKYFYDELIDKNKENRITIQLTKDLKTKLTNSGYYNIQGYISKGQTLDNDSRLKMFFRATKVLKLEKEISLVSEVEFNLFESKFNRDSPNIQDALIKRIELGERPVIDIITGIQSTSNNDYINQLVNKDFYNIMEHKCNLSSKNDIIKFMQEYDFRNTDLLIILRGGGSGLEVFNDIELCETAIKLPVPFITGIGHDEDKTMLQRVSDIGFSTPTSVGVFLQRMIDIVKERKRVFRDKEVELDNYKREMMKEKNNFHIQINSLKKVLNILLIAVLVLVVLLSFISYNFIIK